MPYIPPEVKERIKREISVQRLAEARGIQLRPELLQLSALLSANAAVLLRHSVTQRAIGKAQTELL
jgi:hypothetical protein